MKAQSPAFGQSSPSVPVRAEQSIYARFTSVVQPLSPDGQAECRTLAAINLNTTRDLATIFHHKEDQAEMRAEGKGYTKAETAGLLGNVMHMATDFKPSLDEHMCMRWQPRISTDQSVRKEVVSSCKHSQISMSFWSELPDDSGTHGRRACRHSEVAATTA